MKLFASRIGWLLIYGAFCILWAAIIYSGFHLINSDFHTRRSQQIEIEYYQPTEVVSLVTFHRIIKEENAIEASITLLIEDKSLIKMISDGEIKVALVIYDNMRRYGNHVLARLSALPESIHDDMLTVTSERFNIDAYQSVLGFPFDSTEVFINVMVITSEHTYWPTNIIFDRRFQGKLMGLDETEKYEISFYRSNLEKIIIIASGVLFFGLMLLIALSILSSKNPAGDVQTAIALASFILGAAGFRSIVGLSSEPLFSAFDFVFIIIPICLFSILIIDKIRRRQQ